MNNNIEMIDLSNINRSDLKGIFGMVLQDTWLFSGTIMENIRYGKIDATDEEVKQAAITANINHYIMTQPDTYNMVLNEETNNISGGQKQRILISRALAAKPEILILDDSSSALDYKTDSNLRRALKENMHGTTVITVAQRVSSVKNCDTVMVLDGGQIIGAGTHEELLESCPVYKEISDSQMGGAFVE